MGQLRVAWWREALERIESGTTPKHPVAEALLAASPQYGGELEAMLDAVDRALAEDEAIDAALVKVGAHAQRAWMEVLGISGETAKEAAGHAGAAWASVTVDADVARSHIESLHALAKTVPPAGWPAVLPAALAAQALRRASRGRKPPGNVAMQLTLLRAGLLRRF